MNSNTLQLTAAKLWQNAQEMQSFIRENKESYLVSKNFVAENKIPLHCYAYFLGYVFEVFFLGVPVFSYLHILNIEGLLFYAIVGIITIWLMLIINALIGVAIKHSFNGMNNRYQEAIANTTVTIMSLQHTQDISLERQQKWESKFVFALFLLLMSLLAAGRALIMRQDFSLAQDWGLLLGSFILATVMTATFFVFHSSTEVWKRARTLHKTYNQKLKARDIALNKYARVVEKFIKSQPPFDNPLGSTYTTGQQEMVEKYFSMLNTRNNYDFLVPVQKVFLKVFFAGEPAPEVQVVGFTLQIQQQTLRTNASGMVTIEWRSFNPTLGRVLVGNKSLKNVVASSNTQEVELTDYMEKNQTNRRFS